MTNLLCRDCWVWRRKKIHLETQQPYAANYFSRPGGPSCRHPARSARPRSFILSPNNGTRRPGDNRWWSVNAALWALPCGASGPCTLVLVRRRGLCSPSPAGVQSLIGPTGEPGGRWGPPVRRSGRFRPRREDWMCRAWLVRSSRGCYAAGPACPRWPYTAPGPSKALAGRPGTCCCRAAPRCRAGSVARTEQCGSMRCRGHTLQPYAPRGFRERGVSTLAHGQALAQAQPVH